MTLRAVLMGVAGSGKTSVGRAVSARTGIPYRDGDDLHPAANVVKMRAGMPLTDDDRWPWLDRVAEVLRQDAPLIVGCSALRRVYRDRLRAGAGGAVSFVYLRGRRAVIAARMAARTGHFMPLSLLDSQFATLEPPGADEGMTIDIDMPLDALADRIAAQLIETGRA